MSTFYKHGASGSSSDTIVIKNAKRKWQIIDTKLFYNMRLSQIYRRDFTRYKKGAANLIL